MRFACAEILYALWGTVILAAILVWLSRRRRRILARFVSSGLVEDIAANYSIRREQARNILLVLVYVFSVLALARPQWGFEWQEVRQEGLDILLVVDTSKSMLTRDVKPSRLERTKLAIRDFVKRLKGDRVGIIAFSGEAFLACPLTSDYSGFLLSLDDVNFNSIARGGTNLPAAIQEAVRAYGSLAAKHKVAIVFTDGENLEGDPLAAAKQARDKGVQLFTVGVGTPEGEMIQIPDPEGKLQFLKDDNGNFVKSHLNEELLRQVALLTNGAYARAVGADFGLDTIYERYLSQFEKRETQQKMEKRYFERFQFPLALAVISLVVAAGISTRRLR